VRWWLSGRNRRPWRWLGVLGVALVHAERKFGTPGGFQEGPAVLLRKLALVMLLGVLAAGGAEDETLAELLRERVGGGVAGV
jgi:hypothetical protein